LSSSQLHYLLLQPYSFFARSMAIIRAFLSFGRDIELMGQARLVHNKREVNDQQSGVQNTPQRGYPVIQGSQVEGSGVWAHGEKDQTNTNWTKQPQISNASMKKLGKQGEKGKQQGREENLRMQLVRPRDPHPFIFNVQSQL
jgi:hypothetical protein